MNKELFSMANCCEFYPCHDNPCVRFSCEFCKCPLYDRDCENFGGKPKYMRTMMEVVKDCSGCMLPHKPEFKNLLTKINKNDRI